MTGVQTCALPILLMYADFTSTSELPFASLERVFVLNVSHENDLIFIRMNVQVTYIFIPIVSHTDSFCHRGKSKLGIGPGADPGFFLGGGAPLRNDITDGEVKKKKFKYVYTKKKASSRGGGGAHPLHPPPRSAPELAVRLQLCRLIRANYSSLCTSQI